MAAIALIAAGAVVVLLAVVELISRAAPGAKDFVSSVILGEDGRTSTSKTFILLWTLLVGWALVTLLIAGEFVPARACTTTSMPVRRCHGDDVALLQIGWTHFLHGGLAGSYLVLLGVPAAAGVAAKAITQSQAQSGTAVKTEKFAVQSGKRSLGSWLRALLSRLAEIFSADDGSTDIADFQYVIFNLITATYFVSRFLKPDINGLPTIPDTLLGLTSVSAGLYVGKKAVTRNQPAVSGVYPSLLRDGQQFTVVGIGLTHDPAVPTSPLAVAQITIDGLPASDVCEVNGNLVAIAPHHMAVGGGVITRQLQVLSPYGGITADFPVQCL